MAVSHEWDAEAKALIAWFLAQKSLPVGPYALRSGVTIMNAELFYQRIRENIGYGPGGPRGILGSLKTDLKDLKDAVENSVWP